MFCLKIWIYSRAKVWGKPQASVKVSRPVWGDEEDGDEEDGDEEDGDEDDDGDDNGGGGWGFTDSSDVVDMRSVVNGDGPRALDKTLTQTCKSQSVGGWVC